jgi:hypothetical protein
MEIGELLDRKIARKSSRRSPHFPLTGRQMI